MRCYLVWWALFMHNRPTVFEHLAAMRNTGNGKKHNNSQRNHQRFCIQKLFLWLKCCLNCSKLETGFTSSHIIKHQVFIYGNSKSEAIPMPYPFKILIRAWVLFWNVTFKGEGGKRGSTLRENDGNSAWSRTAMGCSDFTNTIKGGGMWCLNPHSHFRPSSTLLGQRWSYLQGSI